jgi:hypothetical protein
LVVVDLNTTVLGHSIGHTVFVNEDDVVFPFTFDTVRGRGGESSWVGEVLTLTVDSVGHTLVFISAVIFVVSLAQLTFSICVVSSFTSGG